MATRIRLRRVGRKKQAAFRIVVAGGMHARDGRSTETIGKYNPRTHPTYIEVDEKRALYWLRQGAEASDTVRSLFRQVGVMKKLADGEEGEGIATLGEPGAKTIIGVEPAKKKPSKKAVAKAKAAAEAPEPEAKAEAEAPEAEAAAEAPADVAEAPAEAAEETEAVAEPEAEPEAAAEPEAEAAPEPKAEVEGEDEVEAEGEDEEEKKEKKKEEKKEK